MTILRRDFLTAGGLGLLSLPQITQAQEQNGTQHKAVINILMRRTTTEKNINYRLMLSSVLCLCLYYLGQRKQSESSSR